MLIEQLYQLGLVVFPAFDLIENRNQNLGFEFQGQRFVGRETQVKEVVSSSYAAANLFWKIRQPLNIPGCTANMSGILPPVARDLEGELMTQGDLDFARTYSAMADDELIELSRGSASLVDSAQKALQSELDRRGLKPGVFTVAPPEEAVLCPGCGRKATDPLTCGSCSALICRVCGTPLDIQWEAEDDVGEDDSAGGTEASGQAAG